MLYWRGWAELITRRAGLTPVSATNHSDGGQADNAARRFLLRLSFFASQKTREKPNVYACLRPIKKGCNFISAYVDNARACDILSLMQAGNQLNGSTIMRATSALRAAREFGGYDTSIGTPTRADIEAYFTEANFASMFPGDDCTECGGYSLTECAEAVCEEMGL